MNWNVILFSIYEVIVILAIIHVIPSSALTPVRSAM